MRTREDIERGAEMDDRSNHFIQKSILEVLLDIRELLTKD